MSRRVASRSRPNVTCAFTGTGGETPAPSPSSSRKRRDVGGVDLGGATIDHIVIRAQREGPRRRDFHTADIPFKRHVELPGTEADSAQGDL